MNAKELAEKFKGDWFSKNRLNYGSFNNCFFDEIASYILSDFTPNDEIERLKDRAHKDMSTILKIASELGTQATDDVLLAEISRLKEIEKKWLTLQHEIDPAHFDKPQEDKQEIEHECVYKCEVCGKAPSTLPEMPPVPKRIEDSKMWEMEDTNLDLALKINEIIEFLDYKDLQDRLKK